MKKHGLFSPGEIKSLPLAGGHDGGWRRGRIDPPSVSFYFSMIKV